MMNSKGDILTLIGRNQPLFVEDIFRHEVELTEIVCITNLHSTHSNRG